MSDAIGALRARVTLEAPTRVADEIGGAAILWVSQGDVWAAIVAGGVGEGAAHDAVASTAAFRVTINRRGDVRAGWRVVWGERQLRIIGVVDDGAARISLTCEEERQ
jgi:SPP1 family predicted phage head-tail adaptor